MGNGGAVPLGLSAQSANPSEHRKVRQARLAGISSARANGRKPPPSCCPSSQQLLLDDKNARAASERRFSNLKKWIVDDFALPPDYWVMTTYPFCDPAPDGFHYLRRIVEILGKETAPRVISTDFKGPGHDKELKESIISAGDHSGPDMLRWHFRKSAEYGFAGWWIWAYQDQEADNQRTGIRALDGQWKTDLLQAVKQQKQ